MRIYENFNGNWTFRHGFEPDAVDRAQDGQTVRLPHSAIELPYNYFDETEYQKPFTTAPPPSAPAPAPPPR